MDKELIAKEIKETRQKLAALEILASDGEKEAAETIKCPTCGGKVLAKTRYCVKCKKKIGGGDEKEEDKDKKEDKDEGKDASMSITAQLDEIAQILEDQNDPELTKIAMDIDKVSDMIDGSKEAATLEGDSDEPYMKEYFKAGLREGDADEKKYMNEFNTDISKETQDKTQKHQLGKDASTQRLPYSIR